MRRQVPSHHPWVAEAFQTEGALVSAHFLLVMDNPVVSGTLSATEGEYGLKRLTASRCGF